VSHASTVCTEGPASVSSGIGYARVAYLPNLSGNGYVLLIAGLNMITSEAAGQYVVSPALGADLRKLFRIGSYADLPYFEVLLRTSAVDTTPSAVKVVARREIK
jgi:hypothetical protein